MNKEINIFKKIWYSIGKPKKYNEMLLEGLKKAIQYITVLIILFSFVISGITVYKINQNYKLQIEYVENNIPELSYSEGTLKLETEKELILTDEIVKAVIGGTVIINTNSSDEKLVENYTKQITAEDDYGVLLLPESLITISNKNNEIKTEKYTYTEIFEDNFEKDIEFKKDDVIEYLGNVPYMNYFTTYTVTYFVSMYIIMAVNILVMSLVGLVYIKLKKLNLRFKEILTISIYSSTIAILLNIVYYIILGIFNIAIPYFDAVYISVPYIYMLTTLFGIKQAQNKAK